MERIVMYKTKDGECFESEEKARLHESKIEVLDELDKVVDDIYYHYIDKEEITEGIIKHKKELYNILKVLIDADEDSN